MAAGWEVRYVMMATLGMAMDALPLAWWRMDSFVEVDLL
jgi:hypothetical protein